MNVSDSGLEDEDDEDMVNDEPIVPFFIKSSLDSDAQDVPILLWKSHEYNDLGHGHSEFIIGEVTIPVMTLSTTAPAYFPTSSSALLYGVMNIVVQRADALEFLVLSTAQWKVPSGEDLPCLCPNPQCPLRFQWQPE